MQWANDNDLIMRTTGSTIYGQPLYIFDCTICFYKIYTCQMHTWRGAAKMNFVHAPELWIPNFIKKQVYT